ncbi:probable Thiamine biosynthetic bifunctional enzyme [Zygosaccharomyces bailii]|nr:probable Thiamine biosynthetic bifunctional enzyme [Zygosaccharomyces bailii]
MGYSKQDVDYSLYLVTDSTMLPQGTTLYSQVEAALRNGVTLVQLREKETDTKIFIEEALEVQKLCKQFKVPLIINDRIDVALAIDADGVHVGQDDMPIPMVRKLVGPQKIVGWSVGYPHEVDQLAKWGPGMVDYIGIGMVFPTSTKKNPKKLPMGPLGVSRILDTLEERDAHWCRTVAIGGLHPNNIERVLYQCTSMDGRRSVDGISVVSDIMAASDAGAAAANLRQILDKGRYSFLDFSLCDRSTDRETLLNVANHIITEVTKSRPLVHHITNKVHQNFGANVTLALGSSPIMSEIKEEASDLANVPHAALLLNTGSVAPIDVLEAAIDAYNAHKRPIVFDPVGYSATATRRTLNDTLLSCGQFTCIKGNSGEILSLAGMAGKMKGVDAHECECGKEVLIQATRLVAFKFKTIAVCSGEFDFIADGTMKGAYSLSVGSKGIQAKDLPCVIVENGSIPIMGDITASGCSLGSAIACLLGGSGEEANVFDIVISAVALYKVAGKLASTRCQGSGTFHVQLIDALYQLFHANNPRSWSCNFEKLE